MELYDIVDAASKLMKDKTKTLVLHRCMKQHPKFKVYKSYEYRLYMVDSGNKEKTLLLEKIFTMNAPAEELLRVWDECDKEYLSVLIQWIANEFTVWL